MKIFLAADHAGFEHKEAVKKWLIENSYEVKDFGAVSYDEQDDYPDFMHPAAKAVAECGNSSPSAGSGQTECKAILFGGSGQGEAMIANRYRGVRAAVLHHYDENIIKLSREHNDANVLSIGARFVSKEETLKAVKLWLETPFLEEPRHRRRIDKID